MLTSDAISLLFFTFLLAGVVKGVTGMGLPTVAMGILGAFMSPVAAAAMLVVPSLLTNLSQMLVGPGLRALLWRLWGMLLGIVVGTAMGTRLLLTIDPLWSGRALGLALMAYVVCALALPELSVPERLERRLSPPVGLITGVLTGVTGIFTIPAVPYLQSLGLERNALVKALGLSFTVSTLALAGGLLGQDAFRAEQLGLSLLAVAPAFAGMWLGGLVRRRISPIAFRRCFLLLLFLLGLEQLFGPFF